MNTMNITGLRDTRLEIIGSRRIFIEDSIRRCWLKEFIDKDSCKEQRLLKKKRSDDDDDDDEDEESMRDVGKTQNS